MARAIYSSTCPLNLFDNVHWQNALNFLRPSFKVPRTYALSNTLLEAEYTKVKSIVDDKVSKASSLGMQLDGWTNVRNEAIINIVITTPGPVFYKSIATGSESHSAVNMCQLVEEVFDTIGPNKFIGLVSDNAKNMTAMWKLLNEKDTFKHVQCYGCAAHCLNLLAGDIMKLETAHNVLQLGKNIVNTVNRSHIILAQFRTYHKRALLLPVQTRWNSSLACLQSLSNAQHSLQRLVVDTSTRELIPAPIKKAIMDDDIFWVRVQKLVGILEPIARWTKCLEGDTALLGDVPAAFKEIKTKTSELLRDSPFNKREEEEVKKSIDHRATFCLRPIHCAANLLNPKYKGTCLTATQDVDAMEAISTIATQMQLNEATIFAELAEFRLGQGPLFSRHFVWEAAKKCIPWQWWGGICGSIELAKIGQAILQLPATSAATERTFSTFGATHTAKRNRLLVARAMKLAYVKHNLKITENKTHVPQSKETAEINETIYADENDENQDDGADYSSNVAPAAEEDYDDDDDLPFVGFPHYAQSTDCTLDLDGCL